MYWKLCDKQLVFIVASALRLFKVRNFFLLLIRRQMPAQNNHTSMKASV